jgi:cytidyltransferase-like protein
MIVFTSMVGDMFHEGHLNLINSASELGTLIVAIPTSHSNKVVKGHETIISFESRLRILQSIKGVHLVIGYEGADELNKLIELIKPNIVCRADDQPDFIGKETAIKVGAKIILFPYTKGISTTEIRERCTRT